MERWGGAGHWERIGYFYSWVEVVIVAIAGKKIRKGVGLAKWIYWWGVPVVQVICAA